MDPSIEARAVRIAQAALADEIGIVEAAHALHYLLGLEPELASEDDRIHIVGIESETDDLPIGSLRELWHPDFLPQKEREIDRCNQLWREDVRSICERILLRAGHIT